MRDAAGKRYFREALVEFVKGNAAFRAKFDTEAEALMLRVIDGLNLANNT